MFLAKFLEIAFRLKEVFPVSIYSRGPTCLNRKSNLFSEQHTLSLYGFAATKVTCRLYLFKYNLSLQFLLQSSRTMIRNNLNDFLFFLTVDTKRKVFDTVCIHTSETTDPETIQKPTAISRYGTSTPDDENRNKVCYN